jgi:hypothetical protein
MMSKLLKKILFPFILMADEESESTGETIGTENDKRVAMLNAISDRADKERGEEFFEEDEKGNRTPFSVQSEGEETPEGEEEQEDEETVAPEQKTETLELTNVPQKYRIKVNGVEKEVTVDELIATATKVESADQYLADATRLHADAKKVTTPEEPQVVEPDDVALARAIQMGSEEEAVAAIRSLRSVGPTQETLAKTIDERLTFQKAVDKFASEYNDIVSDPLLNQLAVNQDNILRQNGDKRPYYVRYKEIGESIRAWVASKAPQSEPTKSEETEPEVKVETTQEKKNRKAAAPTVPKPAHGKAQVPEEEDEEESVSDTIANMAKARGGPQWLRS